MSDLTENTADKTVGITGDSADRRAGSQGTDGKAAEKGTGGACGIRAAFARLGAGARRLRDRIGSLPTWVGLVGAVVVALLLEVFVFNFRFWQSLGYQETVLRDEPITITEAGYSIGIGSLDLDVKNIKIVTSGPTDNSSIWVDIAVTDEGNAVPYYLPTAQLHTGNERSYVHSVFTYGRVHSIRVTLPDDVTIGSDDMLVGSNSFPLTILSISVNAHVPFVFSWLRFVLALGFVLVIWALWPGRAASRTPALSRRLGPVLARSCTLLGILVLFVLFWLSIPRWVGFATANYNTLAYDEEDMAAFQITGQPDTATNEYGKLAQAFAAGQLDLLQTPPDWLVQMDDPYDAGARDAESAQNLRGYLWDTAYYDGHYYVYFGVLPVLVFYLPFYLMSDGLYLPNSIPIVIATLLFIVGWYHLLRSLVQFRFKKTSLASFLLVFLAGLCCAGLLFGLGRPGLYNVPVTCGRALAIWGLALWYRGWEMRSPVRMCLGSVCMAAIAATRPQLLVLIPLIFVLLFMTLRSRTLARRQKIGWTACLVVPVVIIAAGVMWYNYARFDSVVDFGQNYNLTYNNMTMRGNSLYRVVEGLYYCLLNPPTIVSSFPFIQHAAIAEGFPGTSIYEPLIGGLLWLNPFLLALVFIGRLRHGGADGKGDRPLFWMTAYLLLMALVLCAFDINGAGILLRYFQDWAFIFGLAASLIFLHFLGGAGATGLPDDYVELAEAVNGTGGRVEKGELGDAAGERDSGDVPADAEPVETVLAAEADGAEQPGPIEAVEADGAEQPDAIGRASARRPDRTEPTGAGKRTYRAWHLALFVCVLLGLLMATLSMIFMWNPVEGGVSAGGTYPAFWEEMRQTFMWWL